MASSVIADLERRMEGAVGSLQHNLNGLRTGRASTALLDSVMVDVYGSKMPLNQVGTVSIAEARALSVQVWDAGNVKVVEKAIANAGLGLNPSSDGPFIRVPLPDLSEERRAEMVKVAAKYTEDARIAVRNIRRDGMDALKKMEKDSDLSKDELHGRSDEVQKLTDKYIKKLDDLLVSKEEDIMKV